MEQHEIRIVERGWWSIAYAIEVNGREVARVDSREEALRVVAAFGQRAGRQRKRRVLWVAVRMRSRPTCRRPSTQVWRGRDDARPCRVERLKLASLGRATAYPVSSGVTPSADRGAVLVGWLRAARVSEVTPELRMVAASLGYTVGAARPHPLLGLRVAVRGPRRDDGPRDLFRLAQYPWADGDPDSWSIVRPRTLLILLERYRPERDARPGG